MLYAETPLSVFVYAHTSLVLCPWLCSLLFFTVDVLTLLPSVVIVINISVTTTSGGMALLAFSCSHLFTVQGLQRTDCVVKEE